MRVNMKRTYEGALKLLETRRRATRPKDLPVIGESLAPLDLSDANGSPTFRGTPSIIGMKEWLGILGHSENDLKALNIIHVAGTKGKGSTCAFARSFLQAHGNRTGFPQKVGLYTSPDLRGLRERIQINDHPIIEEHFAKYFFEVWDLLFSQQTEIAGVKGKMPRYLQLLALVAFHTFIREGTDATIIETHHGGEYDATNVIEMPVVTGITSIDMDHVAQLGPTLKHIAWHKAGILKPGALAFASLQVPEVTEVLQARATEKDVELEFIDTDISLPENSKTLGAPVQKQNCSLARALTDSFLRKVRPDQNMHLNIGDISQGIERFSWPGRFEIIREGNYQWFLDGAHNELSVKQAAEWFAKNSAAEISPDVPRILIFSHISEQRDGISLLKCLARSLASCDMNPSYVVFTTYQEKANGTKRLDKQLTSLPEHSRDIPAIYSEVWKGLDSNAVIKSEQSIEGALNFARDIGDRSGGMLTFVTGSLHLVGGALNLLQPLE